jgi:hypothetical protein
MILKFAQFVVVCYVTWILLYGGGQVSTTNPLAAGLAGWFCAFLFTLAWMWVKGLFAGLAGLRKSHH